MDKTPRAATNRDSDKYIVRFPPGMRDKIAEAAKANGRSMNAELVIRIEESLKADPIRLPDALRERLEFHAGRHGRTLNAEIVDRLQSATDQPYSTDLKSDEQILKFIEILERKMPGIIRDQLEAHHIKPFSEGGDSSPENLVLVPQNENRSLHARQPTKESSKPAPKRITRTKPADPTKK